LCAEVPRGQSLQGSSLEGCSKSGDTSPCTRNTVMTLQDRRYYLGPSNTLSKKHVSIVWILVDESQLYSVVLVVFIFASRKP